jgi:hypothetical protein
MAQLKTALNHVKEFLLHPLLYAPLPVFFVTSPIFLPDALHTPALSGAVAVVDQGQAYERAKDDLAALASAQTPAAKTELKERMAQRFIFSPSLSEKEAYALTVAFNKIDHDNPINNSFNQNEALMKDSMRWRDECRVLYTPELKATYNVLSCMHRKRAESKDNINRDKPLNVLAGLALGLGSLGAIGGLANRRMRLGKNERE